MSVYEVHLGSWRLNPLEDNRSLTYLELADELAAYAKDMGFTHLELLPVMHHPFSGSWGYQVTGYYAPSPRFGSPDDFREFVDRLHGHGLGVILDWVPAHFPRDEFALARFDGTALYEHADPRRGAHPDWGTLVFNYGRHEVKNFLARQRAVLDARVPRRRHPGRRRRVDALPRLLARGGRVGAERVRRARGPRRGEVPQGAQRGAVRARARASISAAEESTAWPGVSRPTYLGGLGFGFKWNMGWMHDTLAYFQQDPIYRRYHHHELTFSLVYAFTENFILPLSHDEVVHGKGSLINKMPGDDWQKRANLRALYAFMWAHPGKKLLFMGQEFAQHAEWSHERSLDWHLLEDPEHSGIQSLVRDLNQAYKDEPALWELDFEGEGFWWLEPNDAESNVVAFGRVSRGGERVLLFVANLSPVPRGPYRLGLPRPGKLGRGPQHRLDLLRRDGHGEPRRRRGRADPVAQPGVLGGDHGIRRSCATSTGSTRTSRRCRSSTSTARASGGSSPTTRSPTSSRSGGCPRAAERVLLFVANLSPVPRGPVPAGAAATGPLGGGDQHRLDLLRRYRHRQLRRHRGRADPVAQPGVLGGDHAPADGRDLARAGGEAEGGQPQEAVTSGVTSDPPGRRR